MTNRDCFPGGHRKVFKKPWGPVGLLRSWELGAGSEALPDKVTKIRHPLSRKVGLTTIWVSQREAQSANKGLNRCVSLQSTAGCVVYQGDLRRCVVSVLRPQVVESAFSTPRGCGVFRGSLVCSLSPWGVQGPWISHQHPQTPFLAVLDTQRGPGSRVPRPSCPASSALPAPAPASWSRVWGTWSAVAVDAEETS